MTLEEIDEEGPDAEKTPAKEIVQGVSTDKINEQEVL